MKRDVSQFDKTALKKLRNNVSKFIKQQATKHDSKKIMLLDIAPQDHAGAKAFFKKANIFTADIDKNSGADYIIDICKNNTKVIKSRTFDIILCTEVLEHTLNPFNAVNELKRILKPGGILLVSTPFDFRIHGPLPDCWRFTEHGLRALFKDFEIIEIKGLENKKRFLMPIHYTSIVKKKS